MGSNFNFFGCLLERRVCFASWWDRFWRTDIEHEHLYAQLPNKKMTDVPFQGFVHMTPKHGPPATSRRGKKFTVKIECSLLIKKKQDAVASTSPLECDGTSFELFCHARSQTDQKWPQILVIVACDRLFPHQDGDSYHSREECFANIRFGQCLFISF